MNYLLLLSSCFALFGTWQLCLVFDNHTQKKFNAKSIDPKNALWLAISLVSLSTTGLRIFFNHYTYHNLLLSTLALAAMYIFGRQVKAKTNLATSIKAVLIYTGFQLISTIFLGTLIQSIRS